MNYRIGTRGSKLALVQTEFVRRRLAAACPDDTFEVVTIRTRGDIVTDRPIAAIGDSALFTREIENALLDGRIDLAVHSMKDLAAECPPGLTLAKAWKRADARDVLVCRGACKGLDDLPRGATVATGSVRRNALLRRLRPDLEIVDIRGNVDTRLRKLFDPQADEPKLAAIVLAAAGLERLGRTDVITCYLDPETMIPAANQGQLAIELRLADRELKAKVDALGDDAAETIASVERDFLRESGADCHLPVGAYAEWREGRLFLRCVSGRDADSLVFETRTTGEVTLVGAGPGDPDLITLKGLRAIETADAIVYDRLIPSELLARAKPGCDVTYVGKASGNHALPQAEINLLLLRKAMRYAKVVRLKGGDPFVFGRGGEEMAYLLAHGVSCKAIPGVSSVVAAAESAGIPVTCRGVASGFEAITAHPGVEWCPNTRVYMMGLDRVGEIAADLVASGVDCRMPAAVVSAATTPRERCVVGTLTDIGVLSAALESPAILVVGEVVNLRRRLGFPLSGRRFLVPVIEGGTVTLAERIRALGGLVDEVTVGRIVAIDNALTECDLDGVERIVLTSKNGRLALTDSLRAEISRRGIVVEQVREVRPNGQTLHLTQPDAERVEGVRSLDVYRNEKVPIAGRVDLSRYDAALFTCASSARRILEAAVGMTTAVAIGPKTARALAACGADRVVTASHPSLDELCRTLVEVVG